MQMSRYTAFIPLYPIGVGPGESKLKCSYTHMATPSTVTLSLTITSLAVWTIYQALPFVKEMNIYSSFFEKFFMSYHSFLVVCCQWNCDRDALLKLSDSKQEFSCFGILIYMWQRYRVGWYAIRFFGWSSTCTCSSNASRSWERWTGRNEPEKDLIHICSGVICHQFVRC